MKLNCVSRFSIDYFHWKLDLLIPVARFHFTTTNHQLPGRHQDLLASLQSRLEDLHGLGWALEAPTLDH